MQHGVWGGRSRCARFYDDMVACFVDVGPHKHEMCKDQREDYFECLHHRKLHARIQRVKREKEKLIKEGKWPPKDQISPTSSPSPT